MINPIELRHVDSHPPVVYGPVRSRRFGLSIGVNLMPAGLKLCSFGCIYCQCGPTEARRRLAKHTPFPAIENVERCLAAGLEKHPDVADICFAGDGEPTLHPNFRDAVMVARQLRDRLVPGAKVSVLSNGTQLPKSEVLAGLALADRRVVKLDAAIDSLFRRLDRPPAGLRVDVLIDRIAMIAGVETQTLLVRGEVDNSTDEALDALASALQRIRPTAAQLMTISRRPTSLALVPLTERELAGAADRLRRAVPGLLVQVY